MGGREAFQIGCNELNIIIHYIIATPCSCLAPHLDFRQTSSPHPHRRRNLPRQTQMPQSPNCTSKTKYDSHPDIICAHQSRPSCTPTHPKPGPAPALMCRSAAHPQIKKGDRRHPNTSQVQTSRPTAPTHLSARHRKQARRGPVVRRRRASNLRLHALLRKKTRQTRARSRAHFVLERKKENKGGAHRG